MQDIFEPGPHQPIEPVHAGCRSLGEVFLRRAEKTPDAAACFDKVEGVWQRRSWGEYFQEAAAVAAGLDALGLVRGDVVAVLGPTSSAWGRYDLGAHLLGLVSLGVYPMQAAEQIRYLLTHSACKVLFVSGEDELPQVLEAAEECPDLLAIVPWEDELAERHRDHPKVMSPERFRGSGLSRETVQARLAEVRPEDLAILVYTSGTTGPPKGAMISHANLLALLEIYGDFVDFYQDDLLLSFLPMAHVTERNLAFYLRITTGVPAAYASSIGAVLAEVQEVRPTVFGAVPRIFEKAYDKIQGEVSRKGFLVRRLFAWADKIGAERLDLLLAGEPIPAGLERRYRLAQRLVFRKIHQAFGGRAHTYLTGAAPIPAGVLRFFWGAGLSVYEAYGMTEATVLTHCNQPGAFRLGTVGRPVSCIEQRLAEDGEVLLRGPLVFQGYLHNEAATREALQDGWLHTGDIGDIDAEGYLRITDRKKHLIITAGGKNVAPANIENAIKSQSPLISQVHAHGDRRPYVSAILAPSPIETLEWGAEKGLIDREELETRRDELLANPAARSEALGQTMAKITGHGDFQALFLQPVRRGNRELARVEKVRRFVVLDRDFSQESGEMTPTMKMKRKAIEDLYADTFDRIYSDPDYGIEAEQAG